MQQTLQPYRVSRTWYLWQNSPLRCCLFSQHILILKLTQQTFMEIMQYSAVTLTY